MQWNIAILFFVLSGCCNSLGMLARYAALNKADVVFVAPLLSTEPLFVLIFTTLFLRKKEDVTVSVITGTIAIVAGIAIATLFK